MNFNITDGLDILSISVCDIGSYYKVNEPITVEWDLYDGSISKYSAVLPYNEEYRKEVRDKIVDNLDKDYTNNIEDLYKLLKPLFKIFKNGEYSLKYYNGQEDSFFKINYSNKYWFLIFSKVVDIKKLSSTNQEDKGILWDVTSEFYAGCDSFLLATELSSNIDEERVTYYKEKIKEGSRPAIIIFNCNCYEDDLISSDFILDGHHKTLAYESLKIEPPIIEIKHLAKKKEEVYFDIKDLSKYLYPCQIQDITEISAYSDEWLANR